MRARAAAAQASFRAPPPAPIALRNHVADAAVEDTIRALSRKPSGSLLGTGTGTGRMLELSREKWEARLDLLDLSLDMLLLARDRWSAPA